MKIWLVMFESGDSYDSDTYPVAYYDNEAAALEHLAALKPTLNYSEFASIETVTLRSEFGGVLWQAQ